MLLPSALRLHDLHVASSDKAHMSSYVESDAACNLMAALIVAVKVAYGLCNEAVPPPPGFPARLHWGTWALGCLRRHQSPLEELSSSRVESHILSEFAAAQSIIVKMHQPSQKPR